jgi:hypothetical protein
MYYTYYSFEILVSRIVQNCLYRRTFIIELSNFDGPPAVTSSPLHHSQLQPRYPMQLHALCRGIAACRPLSGRVITSKHRFAGPHRWYTAVADYESKYAEKIRMRAEE